MEELNLQARTIQNHSIFGKMENYEKEPGVNFFVTRNKTNPDQVWVSCVLDKHSMMTAYFHKDNIMRLDFEENVQPNLESPLLSKTRISYDYPTLALSIVDPKQKELLSGVKPSSLEPKSLISYLVNNVDNLHGILSETLFTNPEYAIQGHYIYANGQLILPKEGGDLRDRSWLEKSPLSYYTKGTDFLDFLCGELDSGVHFLSKMQHVFHSNPSWQVKKIPTKDLSIGSIPIKEGEMNNQKALVYQRNDNFAEPGEMACKRTVLAKNENDKYCVWLLHYNSDRRVFETDKKEEFFTKTEACAKFAEHCKEIEKEYGNPEKVVLAQYSAQKEAMRFLGRELDNKERTSQVKNTGIRKRLDKTGLSR